jgi:hypothetical protein
MNVTFSDKGIKKQDETNGMFGSESQVTEVLASLPTG